MKLLIIGGVAGGASAAARARRLDERAEIMILERGGQVSFANCGLPYYIGGEIEDRSSLLLQTPESLARRFKIAVRCGCEATSIDRPGKQVQVRETATGRTWSESYDRLILSPGAAPIVPPIPGADLARVFTLRTVPDAERIRAAVRDGSPTAAVVVGAGFIGLELTENLVRAGLTVHLVELTDQVLPPLDRDAAALLEQELADRGVRLHLGTRAEAIEERPDHRCRVRLADGQALECDLVVLAVGVRPEVALAKGAGLELGPHGGILVDDTLRTSDPEIFAVGDAVETCHRVTGKPALIPLAGPANRQGRIAAGNALRDQHRRFEGSLGTAVARVFSLTAAVTGASEKLLQEEGIPCRVSWTHSFSHATYYPGARQMSVKTIFSPTDGRLLGVQIIGREGVDKRIDVFATALWNGMTVDELTDLDLAYAPPYGSAKDVVNMAGYAASNILHGEVEPLQWHELERPEPDGRVILDVRTASEFAQGHIDRAVNIPVDELRHRLNELPREAEITVYCRVGLRGYLAARILLQHGFRSVRNLSGGFLTYAPAMRSLESARRRERSLEQGKQGHPGEQG